MKRFALLVLLIVTAVLPLAADTLDDQCWQAFLATTAPSEEVQQIADNAFRYLWPTSQYGVVSDVIYIADGGEASSCAGHLAPYAMTPRGLEWVGCNLYSNGAADNSAQLFPGDPTTVADFYSGMYQVTINEQGQSLVGETACAEPIHFSRPQCGESLRFCTPTCLTGYRWGVSACVSRYWMQSWYPFCLALVAADYYECNFNCNYHGCILPS